MGNIVIGQSGGPTAVINSSLAGAIHAAKQLGIEKIYGMHYGIQGFLKEDLIDLGEEYIRTREDIEFLKRTPSAFLGSCRFKLPPIEKIRRSTNRSLLLWKSMIFPTSYILEEMIPWIP